MEVCEARVRNAEAGDLETMRAIARLSGYSGGHIYHMFETNGVECWTAGLRQEVSGYVMISETLQEGVLCILDLCVHPESRRLRVGTSLVEAAQAAAYCQSKWLFAMVRYGDKASSRFLRSVGFREDRSGRHGISYCWKPRRK